LCAASSARLPAIFAAISPTDGLRFGTDFAAATGVAATSFVPRSSLVVPRSSLVVPRSSLSGLVVGAGAGFAALAEGFDFGAAFGFDAVVLPVARLVPDGFAAGRFAGERRLAAVAGFLLPLFAAGFLAVDLLLVAGRDLRAGLTCFLAMIILVR